MSNDRPEVTYDPTTNTMHIEVSAHPESNKSLVEVKVTHEGIIVDVYGDLNLSSECWHDSPWSAEWADICPSEEKEKV